MTMLGMLYKKLRRKVRGYSSEEFIQDLKRGGCTVGEGTFFFNPRETFIDNVKPWLISIGSYCKITARVTILVLCDIVYMKILLEVYPCTLGTMYL